ncbi:hypothetical protein DSECCO2_344920 [anaerobic digester metagenome]
MVKCWHPCRMQTHHAQHPSTSPSPWVFTTTRLIATATLSNIICGRRCASEDKQFAHALEWLPSEAEYLLKKNRHRHRWTSRSAPEWSVSIWSLTMRSIDTSRSSHANAWAIRPHICAEVPGCVSSTRATPSCSEDELRIVGGALQGVFIVGPEIPVQGADPEDAVSNTARLGFPGRTSPAGYFDY